MNDNKNTKSKRDKWITTTLNQEELDGVLQVKHYVESKLNESISMSRLIRTLVGLCITNLQSIPEDALNAPKNVFAVPSKSIPS